MVDRTLIDGLKQLQGLCQATWADINDFFSNEPTQPNRVKLATSIDALYRRTQSVRYSFPTGSMHLTDKDIELLQLIADRGDRFVYQTSVNAGRSYEADRIRLHRIRKKLGVDSTGRAIAVAGALGLVRIPEAQTAAQGKVNRAGAR